jgi:SAM-dependent methyltransferase
MMTVPPRNLLGRQARLAVASIVFAAAAPAWLAGQQTSPPTRSPDVHFVPTDTAVVRAMLEAARVGPKDLVYDLGCGDGRIVIRAVKQHGARGVCVDIDPLRIKESRENADTAGVANRITFRQADLFETDLRNATVVTLYLLPTLNERLRPKLFRELKPGSRVVSNAFDMGEWKADRTLTVPSVGGYSSFGYYWVIPADVAGTWKVTLADKTVGGENAKPEYDVRFEQRYQQVTDGSGETEGSAVPVTNVRLVGDSLSFILGDTLSTDTPGLRFAGRVRGDRMSGKVRTGNGKEGSWTARRTERGQRPELAPSAAAGGNPGS